MKMDRILLKMSGEALAGDKKHGFDEETVRDVSNQVKQIVDKGIQVCVVIGGGNFWRGRTSDNMDRVKADSIGMLATVMNCIYTADSFRSCGIKTHIMTPFVCGNMTELLTRTRQSHIWSRRCRILQVESAIHISQQIWRQCLWQ